MYIFENPVLQRELLANLRMGKAFVLLLVYLALLGGVVYLAWPADRQLDLTRNPESSKLLIQLFFLGQYLLASLMTPSCASVRATFGSRPTSAAARTASGSRSATVKSWWATRWNS